MQRIINEYGSGHENTLIICIAGMHGNEPAGIKALENVFATLHQKRLAFKGHLLGLRGNITALQAKKRFMQEDFNRIWSEANMRIAPSYHGSHAEIKELAEVCHIIDSIPHQQYQQKIFIDLHTTSAENGIFIVATAYESSQHILNHLHAPIILGLEEKLENTAIRYMQRRGYISYAFEGGQHDDPCAITNLEYAMWYTFLHAGCIEEADIPPHHSPCPSLEETQKGLPKVLELVYLHKVNPSDQFLMKPGFKNFDQIQFGDVLARDKNGLIRANHDGYLLMPLYQKFGDDGFFIIQEEA